MIYEHSQTQEPFIIREASIRLDELAALEAELKQSGCNIFNLATDVPAQPVGAES
jgi:hypothetical protein